MIHVPEVRDLVRREVIKHERRRHDEAPGEIQLPRRRARPPPAGGVAQGDFADPDAKMSGVARDGGLEIAARLAHQKIVDPPRDETGLGVHAKQRLGARPKGVLHGLDPDNAPLSGSMVDPVRNAAQRQQCAGLEVERLRRPAQPGAYPGRLPFGKAFCVDEFCARRNRQHEILRRVAKSQDKAARGGGAFEFDPIGLARVRNVEMRDLGNAGRALSYQAGQITRHWIWGAISFPEGNFIRAHALCPPFWFSFAR